MPRETRAQKRERDARESEGGAHDDQRESQPESEQLRKQRARRARPEQIWRPNVKTGQRPSQAREQPMNQRRSARGSPKENDQQARRDDGPVNQAITRPDPLRQIRSGIRRKPFVRWQGTVLPKFDVPCWRMREGVPTLFLHLLSSENDENTADNAQDDVEDIEIDSQSDHDIDEQGQGDPAEDDPGQDTPPPSPPPGPEPAGQSPPSQKIPGPHDRQKPPPRRRSTPPPPPRSDWERTAENTVELSDNRRYLPPLIRYPKVYEDDENIDVNDKILRVEGEPSEEDIHLYGRTLAKFIRSPFNDDDADGGSAWYGVKPLGRGGFGMAGLWEKRDANGRVVDVGIPPFSTLHSFTYRCTACRRQTDWQRAWAFMGP